MKIKFIMLPLAQPRSCHLDHYYFTRAVIPIEFALIDFFFLSFWPIAKDFLVGSLDFLKPERVYHFYACLIKALVLCMCHVCLNMVANSGTLTLRKIIFCEKTFIEFTRYIEKVSHLSYSERLTALNFRCGVRGTL